ncbi:MAG: RDD family protein [Planctomycetaceae bacterium]
MPIKVRCPECSTVMAAPDAAAGKAIKCKSCGGRVPVGAPGGGGGAPRKKKRPRPEADFDSPSDPHDLFGNLNLGMAEHEDERLCPNCAHPLDEEDTECPKCGVDPDTGTISAAKKKRLARKGPPPEEFYGVVFGNAWKFVMDHRGFVIRTGLTWAVSLAMVTISCFVLNWYVTARAAELEASAGGGTEITDSAVIIRPTKDQECEYDGVKYSSESSRLVRGELILPTPFWGAVYSPPVYFWAFIFMVFLLAMGGWAWTLSSKVVAVTLAGEKTIKRFQGDIFGDMTNGFTTIFWPLILMYPIIWIPVAMHFGGVDSNTCLYTFIAIFLLPYVIFLPLAVVHMSQPYTYRAWLISWMAKDWVNTVGPVLFLSAMFFLLVMLIPGGLAIGAAMNWERVADFYTNSIELPALGAVFGYGEEQASSTLWMGVGRLPLLWLVTFMAGFILMTLLAVPSILLMRMFGLFGLYFRPDLSLCVEQVPLSNAGFGPRFLAFHVDMVVGVVILGGLSFAAGFVGALFGQLYGSEQWEHIGKFGTLGIGSAVVFTLYFAQWESGAGRATLGKWSLGMIVLQEDNSPVPFKVAVKRFWLSLLAPVTLTGTFAMCAFNPKHRALHDLATKTKVVWRGDEDR